MRVLRGERGRAAPRLQSRRIQMGAGVEPVALEAELSPNLGDGKGQAAAA